MRAPWNRSHSVARSLAPARFGGRRTEKQTVAFNLRVREEFGRTVRARMGIWEAMEKLGELFDDSDPDVSFPLLPNVAYGSSRLCA